MSETNLVNKAKYLSIKDFLDQHQAVLVAVSKTKTKEAILQLYELGHRIFGENRAKELQEKAQELPQDIKWHMIGHLQSNKVKYIAPYVSMIHSVDQVKLIKEINKRAQQNDKIINILLQIHIAEEETKHGFDQDEIMDLLIGKKYQYPHTNIVGVMGMATFTDDLNQIRKEFSVLKSIFDKLKQSIFQEKEDFKFISMGMSGDYTIAIEEGSNMVRIGSLIFGEREY